MNPYLLNHSGHDYEALLTRWAKIPLHQTELSVEGCYSVFAYENEAAKSGQQNGIYLSTGVHGDECAPVWALLEWVEENITTITDSEIPFVILPCMNPFGLVENQRHDHRGDDLNRMFQHSTHSLIGAWQKFMRGRTFRFTANLHEDYDARGIYLYQLVKGEIHPGEEILNDCKQIIPRETRANIDGSPFEHGLLTHSGDMHKTVEENLGGGYPESIYLYLNYLSDEATAQTFETPSEFSLLDRVKTHRQFLESAISKATQQG